MENYKCKSVGIVGSGIQGVCTGLQLVKKGIPVTIFDRHDPLSNDSYDPFANSLPSKKKKDAKNKGDTSSSLFANGGDDEDDDVFALKKNKDKVSSKSIFDEDSDGALGSISKQSKSKEENSGRSDDLGEFDFSKLDKLGTEKNKTKKKTFNP